MRYHGVPISQLDPDALRVAERHHVQDRILRDRELTREHSTLRAAREKGHNLFNGVQANYEALEPGFIQRNAEAIKDADPHFKDRLVGRNSYYSYLVYDDIPHPNSAARR